MSSRQNVMTRGRLCALIGAVLVLAVLGYVRLRAVDAGRVAEILRLRPGMSVADVGAGGGEWSVELARVVGPEGRVFATEIDAERLGDIERAARRAGVDNVHVVKAGAKDTGLPEACCEAILLRHVYHHLTEPEAMLASLRAALRPGGLMAIVDFEPWGWSSSPAEVPVSRRGHGMPIGLLQEEVTRGGFELVEATSGWSGRDYLVLVRRPSK
jgi:SAM-dependent methyltransferase